MAKQRKRGNGEGSVYEEGKRTGRPTGRWVAQVLVDGKLRRGFSPTEAAAKRKLRDLLKSIDSGRPVTDGNRTVKDLLDDWEAKALPNRNLEPSTLAGHRAAKRALIADIGGKRLRALRPEDVETALEARAARGYSRASCQKLRTTLGMALAWGERRGMVQRNVASVVELPASARPARVGKAMTAKQVRAMLNAAEGTPLAAMWTTMVYLGLRPGEAGGLSWEDIDFTRGVVHVRRGRKRTEHGAAVIGDTKNAQSVRSLDAPPPVLAALRAHRLQQNQDHLAAGALWSNPHDLVFTSATGNVSDPARCRVEFNAVIHKAKLGDGWTPNLLRHTTASLLSDAGVPLEKVADQLGHRDTRMASLHYRHRVRPTIDGGTVLTNVIGT